VQTVRPLGPETGIKLTTARYYTPSGRSIQAKGIVPDVWLDETAEGNVLAALRTREADLSQHLGKDAAREPTEAEKEALRQREQEREQARQRLEEEQRRNPGQRVLPEFGSEQDFQLQQALNQLKGKPVMVSKTAAERPEASSETN
jgi:carboxyl-terminal processing protease